MNIFYTEGKFKMCFTLQKGIVCVFCGLASLVREAM